MSFLSKDRVSAGIAIVAGLAITVVLWTVVLIVFARDERQVTLAPAASTQSSGEAIVLPDETQSSRQLQKINSLAHIGELPSEFERTAALRQFLSSQDEDQLVDLLARSNQISHDFRRRWMQVEIFRRYAHINPTSALGHIDQLTVEHRHNVVDTIFAEWANVNASAAIAHASTLPRADSLVAVRSIIGMQLDPTEESVSTMLQSLGLQELETKFREELAVETAENDPVGAWNALLEDPWREVSQIDALLAVAEHWLNKEGWDALISMEKSLTNRQTRTRFFGDLLSRVATHDPLGAFDQARGLVQSTDQSVLVRVLWSWPRQDFEAAFRAVETVDQKELRTALLHRVYGLWARGNPHEAFRDADSVPREFRDLVLESAAMSLAAESYQDALDVVGTLPRESRTEVLSAIGYWWSKQDMAGALQWALTDPMTREDRNRLLYDILRDLVHQDPYLAMDTALSQPVDRRGFGLEVSMLSNLADTNVDLAVELLPRVREDGSSRIRAYYFVGSELLDAGHELRAFDLGASLPESLQRDYNKRLLEDWASNAPQRMYGELSRLPKRELQIEAARVLRDRSDVLFEHQMESLNAYFEEGVREP